MDRDVIDLGQWNVPTRWEEVTLKQFSDIRRYYADKEEDKVDVREILHILSDHTIDEVNELPIEFAEKILEHLTFLQTKPEIGEPRPYVDIEGTRYQVNVQEKLKTGEYVSVTQVMKDDQDNLPLILAILCRKENEQYTLQYENEELEARMKMFENVPFMDVMPIIHFFINAYIISTTPTLLSSKLREEINHIRKDIEDSVKSGDISKRSTKSVMKTLRKLENTISTI